MNSTCSAPWALMSFLFSNALSARRQLRDCHSVFVPAIKNLSPLICPCASLALLLLSPFVPNLPQQHKPHSLRRGDFTFSDNEAFSRMRIGVAFGRSTSTFICCLANELPRQHCGDWMANKSRDETKGEEDVKEVWQCVCVCVHV